jgi:phage terminase Nu1 subunit (DNA packaging protein)
MSDTPRTDEETFNGLLQTDKGNYVGEFVNASLARQLERELAKAVKLLLSFRREVLEKRYPTLSGRHVDDFLHDRIFGAKWRSSGATPSKTSEE